jgi:methionyl-tRNA formyltransferase
VTLPLPPRFPKRLVFLGTPEVAVPPLRALHEAGYEIALVVSRADKRRGRGPGLRPSPVKAAAEELGLPVTAEVGACVEVGAELGVVVAYGRLITVPVLEVLPMVNLHFSLLPRWRGAAPVERAILAGDAETGVCVMAVAERLDTGDVYACRTVPIGPDQTAGELRAELVAAGTGLLVGELASGLDRPRPQVGEPTYAAKIEPGELHLDFGSPARQLHRVVRLGRAWCWFRGKRVKVIEAVPVTGAPGTHGAPAGAPRMHGEPGTLVGAEVATGDGRLRLVSVQPEGRRPMAAADWLNGIQARPGERLG